MQQYSTTGGCSQGTLDFLHQLVQRHLESVLAANVPESLPENISYDQQPEAPVGGGDDVQPESSSEKKPMSEEAQALVVSCEERVKALAWKYADGSSDRFEELVSIGMVGVCEAAVSLPASFPDPQGYLCQAARHDMIDELNRLHACSTASLDAPLSDSGSFTLHDVLPSLAVVAAAPASKRERALHDALDRLFVRQRDAVRRRAGLPGYGVHSLKEIGRALHASPGAAHCLDQRGRRNLRRDAVLCEVMGVEVER